MCNGHPASVRESMNVSFVLIMVLLNKCVICCVYGAKWLCLYV